MNNSHASKTRVIAILLNVSIIISLFSVCLTSPAWAVSDAELSAVEINTDEIVDSAVSQIIDDSTSDAVLLSTDWHDYYGDLETFTYGLIVRQMEYLYDVFPASVELLDGTEIYGIAYTDYSECYVNDDETAYCFEAGFLPYCGEESIPQEDFDAGLAINNLEYTDEYSSFVLAYGSEPFTEHCVVYGQYLKYGVNSEGGLFYVANDYVRGECDESLGALYSYDEGKYVYDPDMGNYVDLTGISLYEQIDYNELEEEINRILETQDLNSVSVDLETCAYIAQEAVTTYLLSLSEATFLGYNVSELVAAANELDPLECYRLTENGLVTLDFKHDGGASSLTRWLVGTSCVIVAAVGMVGSVVFLECPPLSALAGAMAGTAVEVFMQVVISGEELNNVDWGKVVIAAAAGAVSGYLGPYALAISKSGVSYFFLDSCLDGLIGGVEYAARSWLDGDEGAQIISSFGYGFALGFILSAAFKGAAAVLGAIASKIGKAIEKAFPQLVKKLTAKASAFAKPISNAIKGLKKAADSTVFHSEYISRSLVQRQLQRLIEDGSDELARVSFNHLTVSDVVDKDGNKLTKKALKQLFDKAQDGDVLAFVIKEDEIVQIVKKSGMIGIVFDSSKYQTVTIGQGLVANRETNFEEAARILKEQWLDDPTKIPESIKELIEESGIQLEDMSAKRLKTIIKKSDWVLHENIDMTTITLVPRTIHEEISHMGGFALAKFIKNHMGTEFFDRLISMAATGTVLAAA